METSIRRTPGPSLPEAIVQEIRERLHRDLDRVTDDVRPLVEFIALRLFSPDLDANLLRRHCSPSRATLKRFREQLEATPWAYVNALRMATAERLLETTDLKVWQVAEAVGSRRKGFSARFRNVRGKSPREVRAAAGHRPAARREPRAATQRLDGPPPAPRERPSRRDRPSTITLAVVEPRRENRPVRRVTMYFYDPKRASFTNGRDMSEW